jgi:hypothetical protein
LISPGKEIMVKMVLSAMPTYLLSIYKMPKWWYKRVDIYRKSFLWRGEDHENVKGGHCLVNWQVCTRPKRFGGGGLGIKDLEKFNRVLRLRWLWFNWDHVDRPWMKLMKVTDETDRHLFFASTIISVGNGEDTRFWEAKWLNGASPRDLAPNLFRMARFKRRSVIKELHNSNWVRNLSGINTFALIEEFSLLFMALTPVQLSDQRDKDCVEIDP